MQRKLSLISRLLGYGLALLGTFALGYGEGIQSISGTISKVLSEGLGSIPGLKEQLLPTITSYYSNTISPPTPTYEIIGAVLAAAGAFLVLLGDRKMTRGKAPAAS